MIKKILIFYGSYGAGHFSAARSIKEYIDSNYPNTETQMIDCIEYINKYYNKLTVKTYDELSRKLPLAWKGVYYGAEKWPIKKITSATNHLFAVKLNRLIKQSKPDLIISTHFFASEMCGVLKKRHKLNCKIATILTDYALHDQWIANHKLIDYFFVAHNGMKNDLVKKGVDDHKIYATGIPLSNIFLLNYNKGKILKEFNLEQNKTTVLFFASGSSHVARGTTINIFNSFISSFPNIQTLTITGKSTKLKREFDELVKENHREKSIKVLPFTEKVPELMYASDVVITKPGGLTTTESLASGLPIVIIDPIPGQEVENASFLEKQGAAIWIKKNEDAERVLFDLLSNTEKMNTMKKNAELLAKKNSTKDICSILMN